MTQKPTTPLDLETAIRAILARHRCLYEFRLQNLLYLVDLIYKVETNKRALKPDFKPHSYGAFSQDVRGTLEEMEPDIPSKLDWHHGKPTTKYLGGSNPRVDEQEILPDDRSILDEDLQEIIEVVRDMTRRTPTADLEAWSKESWLYKDTEYGEAMDFDRVDTVSESIKDNILESFPESERIFEGGS